MDNSKTSPVRIAAIGLGNRTRKYLKYVETHPEEGRVSAIVEPSAELRRASKAKYGLSSKDCFSTSDEFFKAHRDVDAVIIGTPDETHYEICKKAIAQGYNCLLEKPVAETADQCIELCDDAFRKGVIVCVCYVLRYHPYYIKLKEILDSKEFGPIISVSHIENVGLDRMTHSYVRGIFSNSEESSPMFLSKCCHDVDILLWLTGKHVSKISSFGNLNWFKPVNAPAGSAERCVDCSVEEDCPFSAVDLYKRRKDWISNFIVPKGETLDDVIDKELKEGRFGRCAYHCDNSVVDHQNVNLLMTDNTNIVISMDAFTRKDQRITKIECAFGEILADEKTITVYHLRNGKQEIFNFSDVFDKPLHGSADLNIVEDFLKAVSDPDNHKVRCSIADALESHLVCFRAEDARLSTETVTLSKS